jgi:glycosyltransferase involved in cell wall biosynthesis
MSNEDTFVSIGLPTLNGERWLAKALDSLLAQSHENFEIVISDNASSDNTAEIAQRYAKDDGRIRYVHNQYTLPHYASLNQAFRLSQGDYFMWAADHDLWEESFIEQLLEVLVANPDTALVYPRSSFIGPDDEEIEDFDQGLSTEGLQPAERFLKILVQLTRFNMFFGLYRVEHLRQTRLFPAVLGGGRLLLCELSLHGEIRQVTDRLLHLRRKNPEEKAFDAEQRRIEALFGDQRDKWKKLAPHLDMVHGLLEIVIYSELSGEDKRKLLGGVMGVAPKKFPFLEQEVQRLLGVCTKMIEQNPPNNYFIAVDVMEMLKCVTLISSLYRDLEPAKEARAALLKQLQK